MPPLPDAFSRNRKKLSIFDNFLLTNDNSRVILFSTKGKIPERNGDCMKWTPTASLRLTTILNWVALGVVTFLMFFIPVMAKWYDDVSHLPAPVHLPVPVRRTGADRPAVPGTAAAQSEPEPDLRGAERDLSAAHLLVLLRGGTGIPGACLVPLPGTAGGIRRRILRTDPPGAEKRVRPGGGAPGRSRLHHIKEGSPCPLW